MVLGNGNGMRCMNKKKKKQQQQSNAGVEALVSVRIPCEGGQGQCG